ncbi:glycoside hydrolase family protein [Escherichia coli]|uniref:glycoside hydrolase family protein n=1 Tax=Escherichia coli TaxID=562 RepID=UPI000B504C5B|nr:glycoside hydrolase family protein [Escherichia coli]OWS77933.1 lysozyme [Escherichia coli]
MNTKIRYGLSAAVLALIGAGASAPQILDQFLDEKEGNHTMAYRDGSGIWTICRGATVVDGKTVFPNPYNIGPGKCFPSTFYKRLNAGDRKGACEAIRWWIKDGGRDCRIRSNNCYGQVIRRDQESALTCWGIEQ